MEDFDAFVELRQYLDKLVEQVRNENKPHDLLELAVMTAREIASRARLQIQMRGMVHSVNLLPVEPQAVVVVHTEDDDVLIYIYTEIEHEDETGLYGFGYAYNLSNPDLSEIGWLWSPPMRSSFKDQEVH